MNVKWRRKRRRCSCIIEWSESIPSDHHHLILNVRLSWRYFWQVLISCGIYNTQLLARWLDMLQNTYSGRCSCSAEGVSLHMYLVFFSHGTDHPSSIRSAILEWEVCAREFILISSLPPASDHSLVFLFFFFPFLYLYAHIYYTFYFLQMLLDRRNTRDSCLPRFKPSAAQQTSNNSNSNHSTVKNSSFNQNTQSRPQTHLHHAPAGLGSSSSSSKNSLIKPLGNSFRRRTPLFSRRLSSSNVLKQSDNIMEKQLNNRHSSLIPHTTIPSTPTYIRPTTSPTYPPTKQLPTVISNQKLIKPKQRLPVLNRASLLKNNNNNNNKSPEAPVMQPISMLSLGIQYTPKPHPINYTSQPTPTQSTSQPSPTQSTSQPTLIPSSISFRPSPRASSLNFGLKRLSCAVPVNKFSNIVPSTPHFHYPPGLNNITRRASTLTLASTCSADSDQEYKFSDLASIHLPSPTDSFHPSIASIDLLSDFPMPPSRTPYRSPACSLMRQPSFSLAIDTVQDLYHPYQPPQIPLPPLPSPNNSRFHFNPPSLPDQLQLGSNPSSPSSHPDNTPTQPMTSTEALPARLPHLKPFHPPDLSSSGDNLDDFFDLYDHSPLAPQRFMRLKRPHDMSLGSTRTALTHTNLLEVDLPTSRHSHPGYDDDDFIPEEEDDHSSFVVKDELVQFTQMRDDDDDEEGDVSEIDLNEPLNMMAVRLGYQLDLPDASDSDDDEDVDLRRFYHFDNDEDELLDNRPPMPSSSRGHGRPVLQIRSLSSLRVFWQNHSCRSRAQRVVIAEVSSSDEEEFDLKLDHAHLSSKHQQRKQANEDLIEKNKKEEIKRSSYGSAGTQCSYTATTPSSSSSSDRTSLPTPESAQASTGRRIAENNHEMIRGVVGLGFDMGEAPHQTAAVERLEYFLPGIPGSVERQQWLHRAFSKHEKSPMSIPLSLPLASERLAEERKEEQKDKEEEEEGRASSQPDPPPHDQDVSADLRRGCVSPTLLSPFAMDGSMDDTEKEECLALEQEQGGEDDNSEKKAGQTRLSVATSRRLKPLARLVDPRL
ncbi:hypothetical protein VP01_400g13 [Puccinia sorghi]|uniref:Uncharacterized protein n=1 Tax=Puccinia sorghi TaxID=27349 RepID=A0A0L6URZ7_9BASI|nr:hypothetical protein VP01_400g13 [Puccinia sorghi]